MGLFESKTKRVVLAAATGLSLLAVGLFSIPSSSAATSPLPWYSGAENIGVNSTTTGTPTAGFAAARGAAVDSETAYISWAGTAQGFITNPPNGKDGEIYNYTGLLAVDLGWGNGKDTGSWSAAASGAYDAAWRTQIQSWKTTWNRIPRSGNVYFQFAHEMNGNWYNYSVKTAADAANFKAAWIRLYNIKQQVWPSAKMSMDIGTQTSPNQVAWTTYWPGDQYVDLLGVDTYDMGGSINSPGAMASYLNDVNGDGSPGGLETLRVWAGQHGVPLGVPEWGTGGDNTSYIQGMYDFFKQHGSRSGAAGTVLFENYFNGADDTHNYEMFPKNVHPNASALYDKLWSTPIAGSAPTPTTAKPTPTTTRPPKPVITTSTTVRSTATTTTTPKPAPQPTLPTTPVTFPAPTSTIPSTVTPPSTATSVTNFAAGFENGTTAPTWNDTVDNGDYPSGSLRSVMPICCGAQGPESSVRTELAHTGSNALLYSGIDTSTSLSFAYNKVFDLSAKPVAVAPKTYLSYWIFPQSSVTSPMPVAGSNSACVALDLIFNGGTNLRDSGAVNQHGVSMHPDQQCAALVLDKWNYVVTDVGAVAAGKQIQRIDVGYDQPGGSGGYRGYVDDIRIFTTSE